MLDKVMLEETIRARSMIQRILEAAPTTQGGDCSRVRLRPLPDPARGQARHVAVDGGHHTAHFEGYAVYLARAWGRQFSQDPSWSRTEQAAAVGVVIPPENPEDRVSYYREALEAMVAARLVDGAELVLFDGSIRGAIRWWRPGYGRRGPSLSEMLEEAERIIVESASKGLLDLPSCPKIDPESGMIMAETGLRCVEEFVREAPFPGQDRGRRPASNLLAMRLAEARPESALDVMWAIALESTEKLYLYKVAIEEAWRHGATPVFISKTSTGTRMCGGPSSDLYILRKRYPLETGVVLWDGSVMLGALEATGLEKRGERKGGGKAFYPRILGLDEFYVDRLLIVEFYARLARNGQWLLIDLALDRDLYGEPGPGEAEAIVEDAVSRLLSVPLTRGYPLSLVVAHRHARLTPEEARYYLAGLGLRYEPRARGMLRL